MRTLLILLVLLSGFGNLKSQDNIRIMTYNIKYDAKNDTANNWQVRQPWVGEVLTMEQPHILGVQEALINQVDDIKQMLGDYTRVGTGRDDGKDGGEFSAVFFDNAVFTSNTSGTFWLSETPSEVSVGWDAALPRVCTFVILQEKSTGRQLAVYNAHLDHIGEISRRNAIRVILDHATENAAGLPLVVMGDFNFTDSDAAFETLTTFPLKDSREAERVFGPKETFNGFNWNVKPEVRIDYIFASQNINLTEHKVITTSFPMRYPSDHFPVQAAITFE